MVNRCVKAYGNKHIWMQNQKLLCILTFSRKWISNTVQKPPQHTILIVTQWHGSGYDSSEPTMTHYVKESSEFVFYMGNRVHLTKWHF